MAHISSIMYSPTWGESKPKTHFSRLAVESAQLIEGYGIEGDRKGGHPARQLNILSTQTVAELAAAGYQVAPGAMGEQLIVDGLNVNALVIGDWIQLGDAIVEVTSHRRGCPRFQTIQGLDLKGAEDRMGIMCKVIHGGAIHVGDPVKLAMVSVT